MLEKICMFSVCIYIYTHIIYNFYLNIQTLEVEFTVSEFQDSRF